MTNGDAARGHRRIGRAISACASERGICRRSDSHGDGGDLSLGPRRRQETCRRRGLRLPRARTEARPHGRRDGQFAGRALEGRFVPPGPSSCADPWHGARVANRKKFLRGRPSMLAVAFGVGGRTGPGPRGRRAPSRGNRQPARERGDQRVGHQRDPHPGRRRRRDPRPARRPPDLAPREPTHPGFRGHPARGKLGGHASTS